MQNITLVKGKCATCGSDLDPAWCGDRPSLGTTCRGCYSSEKGALFTLANIELVVQPQVNYDPLFGVWEYHFDFAGTKVLVNDSVGTIQSTQADLAWVKFDSDDETKIMGTPIKKLGYWDLKNLYAESGGQMDPPPLDLPAYVPAKAELRPEPVLPVTIAMFENCPVGVDIGSFELGRANFKSMSMLQAFCNMYVRWKFGLAPNFCFEGGFIGQGFEVRNGMNWHGLNVDTRTVFDDLAHVETAEGLRHVLTAHALEQMSYGKAQAQDGVVIKDASVWNVLTAWTNIMHTLLRFDWEVAEVFDFDYDTVGGRWSAFMQMKNVLLNVLSADEIDKTVAFAQPNRLRHYGSAY